MRWGRRKVVYNDAFFKNSLFTRAQFVEWGYIDDTTAPAAPFSPPFAAPATDNERLLNWQAKWFYDGDKTAWGEIWSGCAALAKKIIAKERKSKGLYLSREKADALKCDACIYVLRRIQGRSGEYRIKNFVASLYFGVKHALYYRTSADKIEVLLDAFCRGGKAAFDDEMSELAADIESLPQEKRIARWRELAALREKTLELIQGEANKTMDGEL